MNENNMGNSEVLIGPVVEWTIRVPLRGQAQQRRQTGKLHFSLIIPDLTPKIRCEIWDKHWEVPAARQTTGARLIGQTRPPNGAMCSGWQFPC